MARDQRDELGRVAPTQPPVGHPFDEQRDATADGHGATSAASSRTTDDDRRASLGARRGQVMAHTAAKLPHMKTSEWAKLISRSTP